MRLMRLVRVILWWVSNWIRLHQAFISMWAFPLDIRGAGGTYVDCIDEVG